MGIFTERDVLVGVIGNTRDLRKTKLSEVTKTPVRTIGLTTSTDEALCVMSEQRYWYFQVVVNNLKGLAWE
jgi:CBS domain-containing protein